MPRRKLLHKLSAIVTTMLLAFATPAAAQGVITGLVVDDGNGLAITGASVRIASLNREVFSDRTGRFVMTGVPAGAYDVTTRYIGYAPLTNRISVTDRGTMSITFRIKTQENVLGTVAVVATRSGQASALNQQKNAANVTNVIAADQIGRFPDANLGDALKRVPGVTVALDQGEARFGSIRGTEPRFNSVMVNGERVPSAEAEVREVQLDLIPADMVQAIEVNKTLTPDMDADAIGGSVNVVTRAAPAGFRMSATAGSGYNFIREKPVALGGLVIGNRFLNNKFGVIASASYYDQQFGSDNKEGVWNRTDAGQPYMEEFEIRRYDVQRTRRSLSAGLDYRFNENNSIMLRSLYNSRDDWENRFVAGFEFGEPDAQGVQEAELVRETKGGGPASRVKNARLEDQRTQSHMLSGEHLLGGRATLTWQGSIGRASETRPDERYIVWANEGVNFRANYADQQNPSFTALNAAAAAPSAFSLDKIEQLDSYTKDEDRNARIDLMFPLREGENATRLKVGGRYRGKEKLRDNSFFEADPLTAFGNLTAAGSSDFTTSRNYSGNYQYGVHSTPDFLAGLNLFNPSQFELSDTPDEYVAGNFDATERVTSGYSMIEQRFGPRLSLIAGVRVENTNVDYNGFEFDVDEETSRRTSGSQSYTDVLPSINARWDAAPNTVLRAAWTNSIARPNYFDLVPYREISLEDDELSLGNPNLNPTRSMNFDLMAERYFESVGVFSVGVYHKRITDFVFNLSRFGAVDPVTNREFSQINQPLNGAEAQITGFETAFQRQLDFLPGLLRYVGVYVNYNYNDSNAEGLDLEGRELEELPLLGTAKHSGNLSLSFDAPRVSMRVAFNYQSESLDAGEGGYNEDAFFDRWSDRRTDIDANASVQITPVARFFVEANNLNNRPLRFFQGNRGRLMQDEFYGRRIQTGFKFDF